MSDVAVALLWLAILVAPLLMVAGLVAIQRWRDRGDDDDE